MKTLDRRAIYLRGLIVGVTLGALLAPLLVSYYGGPAFRGATTGAAVSERRMFNVVFVGVLGFLGGVGVGLLGAAVFVELGTSESREQARHGAPPAVFPGLFGNPGTDPFSAIKQRIDEEEPAETAEPAPAPPAVMPEKCPACGEKLEPPAPDEPPSAFCYHCGGALS